MHVSDVRSRGVQRKRAAYRALVSVAQVLLVSILIAAAAEAVLAAYCGAAQQTLPPLSSIANIVFVMHRHALTYGLNESTTQQPLSTRSWLTLQSVGRYCACFLVFPDA
jgi:hypothetical protein